MIGHLERGTRYAVHLRAPSVSGGKDWIGSLTAAGTIHTFWGKTGQINQHAGKPGDRNLLARLIREKQAKGYRLIDEYHEGNGWRSRPEAPGADRPKPQASAAPPTRLLRDTLDTLAWDF